MGWGFRRSLKLGPLKLNFSKSGIGYSVGVRGFRVGKDARGRSYTSASIPGTGLYNRTYTGEPHPTEAGPHSTTVQQPAGTTSGTRGWGVALLFVGGVLFGMLLMAFFISKPAPAPVPPPTQPILNSDPAPVTQPAKRRRRRVNKAARQEQSSPAPQSE